MSESNFRTNAELEDFERQDESLLREKREIVSKLERQNKEIINEINRLKLQQMSNRSLDKADHGQTSKDQWLQQQQMLAKLRSRENTPVLYAKQKSDNSTLINSFLAQNPELLAKFPASVMANNPQVVAELATLKTRKGMLQSRMTALENSRDELISRLTQLTDNNYGRYDSAAGKKKMGSHSLRTTPVSSPRPGFRLGNLTPQNLNNYGKFRCNSFKGLKLF